MLIKPQIIVQMLFIIIVGASCVQNKKLLYLQTDNELKNNFRTDSILRTYNLENYEYRIQPEDILSIQVESLTQEDYNIFSGQQNSSNINPSNMAIGGYLVNKNGEIRLPEIGAIGVGGLTIHEIEEKLRNLAADYVDQPTVKIRLLNYRVTLLGEVNSEGIVSSFDNRMSIMEAIGKGGGLTDLADRSNVKIIRQINGKANIYYIDLLNENLLNNPSFFTHQNDIIIVSPLRQRPFRKYFGENISLFVSTVSVILLTINLISN